MITYLCDVPEDGPDYDIHEHGVLLHENHAPTPEVAALAFASMYARKHLSSEATMNVRVVCERDGQAAATLDFQVRVVPCEDVPTLWGWRAEILPARPTLPRASKGSSFFELLAESLGVAADRMGDAVRNARAMAGLISPDPAAEGLPCPHCGEKLRQLDCHVALGHLFARVNMKVDSRANLRGLVKLLTNMGTGLPEKSPPKGYSVGGRGPKS